MKPFGAEYAFDPKWGVFQRFYIRFFGVIDLPTRVRARAIRKILKKNSCKRFLDFGAGTGVYSYFLSRGENPSGLAVDIDEQRILGIESVCAELGISRLRCAAISEAGLSSLPEADYDLVLAIEVLMCFQDPVSVLRKLRERMNPDGILIAHLPIQDSARPYELTLFTESSIVQIFEQAGFESPQIYTTFGRYSAVLCEIFASLVKRQFVMALVYPFLLFAIALSSPFVSKGSGRLIAARQRPRT